MKGRGKSVGVAVLVLIVFFAVSEGMVPNDWLTNNENQNVLPASSQTSKPPGGKKTVPRPTQVKEGFDPGRMPRPVVLTVIPEPPEGSRIVLRLKHGTTIIRGRSNLNLLCGNCTNILAEGVAPGQFTDIVLFCNNCGSFNDTEACNIE